MDFFKAQTTQGVKEIIRELRPLGMAEISVEDALGRVLADDVIAPDAFPLFDRSTMDGYAVRAVDTFGASDGSPALLEITGEVRMGEKTSLRVNPERAVRIATGGMLPVGADAVAMVEHTQTIDEHTIQVYRAVAPGENVIQRGEDLKKGEVILMKGHRLRPQDMGILATLGRGAMQVYRRPRVGIISSGDEIVPIECEPQGGEIRDTNRYTLWGLTVAAGGEPFYLGIARDELKDVRQRIDDGLSRGDIVVISGGSSVGNRDLTIEAISSLPGTEILVHGVAVSPGKPTILATAGNKVIWGLPGHPVSAMVIFMVLVNPSIRRMGGCMDWDTLYPRRLRVQVSRNIPSAQGREDYVRVKLTMHDERLIAVPIFGKSGSLSAMVKGDGLIKIEMDSEGLQEGEEVEVWPF